MGSPEAGNPLVEEARRLSEAATPGPWVALKESPKWNQTQGETVSEIHQESRLDSRFGCIVGCWYDYSQTFGGMMSDNEADAEFIAHSRTLLPELAERLDRAVAVVEAAQNYRDRTRRWPFSRLWHHFAGRSLDKVLAAFDYQAEEEHG